MTMGYSPAMIEQVCSMALTVAHHTGREAFGWEDIVEAMTTVESGTAVNIEYVPEETRAVAVHEAGHAVAAHAYMKGAESTRLSIRRRGGSLGHHMALQKEERFSSWRSEEMARLIWALGAMAAERVFYGENSTGVGGDVQARPTVRRGWSARAAWRPSASSCAATDESEDEARERVMKRFERIGTQIVNRTGAGTMEAAVLHDHEPARRWSSSCSGRPTSPRTTWSRRTRTPSSGSPTSSSCAASCTATRSSSCSTRRSCACPRST